MSESSQRVVILDVSHLFYKYAFGTGGLSLTATIYVNGVPTQVNTTIPTMVIKQVHRLSNFGINPTVVCFDSRGCGRSRKAYFASHTDSEKSGDIAYKNSRDSQNDMFYQAINLSMNLLYRGGVDVLKADGYEADDLIKCAVDKAKEQFDNLPIHIITGDADLVPLVDDRVSVFLSSRKTTYAEKKEWELNHYVQITPENYEKIMTDVSTFKTIEVPYNTVVLAKCLRGDKSDNITGYPKFTPTRYNKLIDELIADKVDLSNTFRYGNNILKFFTKNGVEITRDEARKLSRDCVDIKIYEPKECVEMCNVLSKYLDEDIIRHIRRVYNGINLNGGFSTIGTFNRLPATKSTDLHGYSEGQLQAVVSEIKVNLPKNNY